MIVRNTLVHSCGAIMLFSFDQTITNVVMNSRIMLEHCVCFLYLKEGSYVELEYSLE